MRVRTLNPKLIPIILSYGMGVESTAILLRWLLEAESRDFDLSQLIVITAMTGDEWREIGPLVEQHILPLLRKYGVRYVQVARAGPFVEDGLEVLSDTREPSRLYLDGKWRLSDELLLAGTVPQFAQGKRLCSLKHKGWPLDGWLEAELGERKFRHVMGFNSEELTRVEQDRSYSRVERSSEYPLVRWGWNRAKCEAYLLEKLGVHWPKSCCVFCPFAGGKESSLYRFHENPEAAAQALWIEHLALALNPRSNLYSSSSLRRVLEKANATRALELLQERLAAAPWTAYRVQRVYLKKGVAWRRVQGELTGSREEVEQRVRAEAHGRMLEEGHHLRLYLRHRAEGVYPAVEEFLVAGPAGAEDKARSGFEAKWREVTGGRVRVKGQLTLGAA